MKLTALVEEYGVKNIRFFMPMSKLQFGGLIPGIAFRVGGDPQDIVECAIDESRYKVDEGYKITLAALDESYGKDHFYQSDLEQILRSNPETSKVCVLTIDGYQQIQM